MNITEESVDERNNLREYRHYTHPLEVVPDEDIEAEKERLDKLYEKHSKPKVNIWGEGK
jgi:hypothetical protein